MKKKEKYLTILLFGIALIFALLFYQQITALNKNPFADNGGNICTADGKPIIRLYSTTACPHCEWVSSTFDKVAKEYAANGSIVAYHWEMDTYDDTLTTAAESVIPQSEVDVYKKYSPEGYVPAFVLGCKYTRIGNSFETQQNLTAEEAYLREMIGKLL
jgi:thiol-disulfide isomerase/thioredoxin